mmetsp:Transcript_113832/g.332571  ORF Transcript_113832/g.332571 Transcript_113832/m.332571 type:complete len:470 (+) Transcript_113832:47-1456(+)
MIDFDEMDEAPGGRLYDLVIYGATGFTGCLLVEHLDAVLSDRRALPHKWAIAGRDVEKLKQLSSRCKCEPDVLEASTDEQIRDMADLCTVVVAAAGPFSLCGEPVIKACIEKHTHYIDVTGEVVWMAKMIRRYNAAAKENGVMIIPCVGAMCAPNDINLYLLAQKLGPLKQFRELAMGMGGQSGGTFFTGYKQYEGMTPSEFQDVHLNPFSLGGQRGKAVREEDADQGEALQDADFPGVWTYPGHTTHCAVRLMRRSAQLFEDACEEGTQYGKDLVISSCDITLDERTAKRMVKGAHGPQDVGELVKFARTMEAMANVAPKKGGGPPAATRQHCFYEAFAIAEGENGEWAHVHLTAPEGYELTAMTSIVAALVLLEEAETVNPKERGGVVTGAFALRGTTWIERLGQRPFGDGGGKPATFEVHDGKPAVEVVQEAAMRSDATGGFVMDGQRKGTLKAWAPAELYTRRWF